MKLAQVKVHSVYKFECCLYSLLSMYFPDELWNERSWKRLPLLHSCMFVYRRRETFLVYACVTLTLAELEVKVNYEVYLQDGVGNGCLGEIQPFYGCFQEAKACAVKHWTTFEGVYISKMVWSRRKKMDMYKQCCLEKKVSYLQESQNAIVGSMSDLRQEAPKCVS